MEMVLVAAIMPVVFFSVFANMSSGMRTWKALNQPVSEEGTVVFLDRAQTDFANAFVYKTVPFTGDAASVSFAAPVDSPPSLGAERGIGRIGYRYDASRKAIVRDESNFSDLYKEAPPYSRPVLGEVEVFSIEYLSYVPTDMAFQWRSEWQPGKRPLPAAVRLTVERSNRRSFTKSFLVPCGN